MLIGGHKCSSMSICRFATYSSMFSRFFGANSTNAHHVGILDVQLLVSQKTCEDRLSDIVFSFWNKANSEPRHWVAKPSISTNAHRGPQMLINEHLSFCHFFIHVFGIFAIEKLDKCSSSGNLQRHVFPPSDRQSRPTTKKIGEILRIREFFIDGTPSVRE